MAELRPLYPAVEPRETGMLDVSDGHTIYWERSGNPQGIPAVFLHGGPGSGTSAWQRRLFNPAKYDIILFDQRGSGRSTPHAALDNNTTPHLVADIERLRAHLGVKSWVVAGGSWGATLALAYAHAHPEEVRALCVYGVFLCREEELHDLYFEGGVASRVFPDVFAPYIGMLDAKGRENPIEGYGRLFRTGDRATRLKALDLWTRLEKKVSRLVVTDEELFREMADPDYVLAHSLIENHYFLANGFIDGDALLKTIGARTAKIPLHIVQGRYDMVCPFVTAWELHKAVPHSVLHVIDDAGHTAREPKLHGKLVEILDGLAG